MLNNSESLELSVEKCSYQQSCHSSGNLLGECQHTKQNCPISLRPDSEIRSPNMKICWKVRYLLISKIITLPVLNLHLLENVKFWKNMVRYYDALTLSFICCNIHNCFYTVQPVSCTCKTHLKQITPTTMFKVHLWGLHSATQNHLND